MSINANAADDLTLASIWCDYCSNHMLQAVTCIIGAIIGLFFAYKKYIEGASFTKNVQLCGKTVIVTGSNIGIGKETALQLAKRGAKVILACRNLKRANEACLEIIRETNNADVYVYELDLGSFSSIRQFVKRFLDEEERLDILINNAAILLPPDGLTEHGLEAHFGVNHVGHFLLTNLLVPRLKECAPSRIVIVSSKIHLPVTLSEEDLNTGIYQPQTSFRFYAKSKLANILYANELARRLDGTNVTVNSLNPGAVSTSITRHIQKRVKFLPERLFFYLSDMFMRTPLAGCQTTLVVALDPSLANVTGKYFDDCKLAKTSKVAEDEQLAKYLWDCTENIIRKIDAKDDNDKAK